MRKCSTKLGYIHVGAWPIYIGWCICPDALVKELKFLKVAPDAVKIPDSGALCSIVDRGGDYWPIVLITIAKYNTLQSSELAGLVAHEAYHAVEYIREQFNYGNVLGSETEAYLIGYITGMILEGIRG